MAQPRDDRTETQNRTMTNRVQEAAGRLIDNIGSVVVGKEETISLAVIALLCQGHVLIEDVPGLGKTLLARCLAKSIHGSFKRIQFTPDLLPSDVTGLNFFNQKEAAFQFVPGPIMANFVLADEINRASPRTQACLLEAMEERQVTIDNTTYPLPRPFMVLATQNPVEQEGTFPLPEAQLDRFLIRLKQGYPTMAEEKEILVRFERDDPFDRLEPVLAGEDLIDLAAQCRGVFVEDSVRDYLIRLVRATRKHPSIRLGASPRAAQGLYLAAQCRAALTGRDYVLPDDVKALAEPVLAHRLLIDSQSRLRGQGRAELVAELIDKVALPAD